MATYESKKYAIPGANITNIAATAVADGSVTDSEYQFINTLASNAQTQITAKLPKAGGTMTGGIVFPDDSGPAPAKVSFGAGDDLRVFSDGTTGFLKGNDIRVVNSSDVEMIKAASGGAVDLRHNGTTRVSTSGSGATINGTLSATTVSATTGSFTNVSGNGSSLTNIPAGNLTGTVADARLSTVSSSKLSGALPAIDGSALTGISSSPSVGAIGDIRPFVLVRSSGSGGSVTLSAGTTFTPSSYSSNNMIIANYGTSVQNITLNANVIRYGALHGYASLSNHTSGSASSYSGTWRVIFPLNSGTGSGGQGNSSYTYYYSLAGMAMRIS